LYKQHLNPDCLSVSICIIDARFQSKGLIIWSVGSMKRGSVIVADLMLPLDCLSIYYSMQNQM
jgi:hypothetical protein